MDGNDRGYEASSDVLEHGGEPGRLARWSRRRVVRGTATWLLMLAVLTWLLPGSGPAGSSGPGRVVGESAARAGPDGPQTPAAVLLQGARAGRGEGDHECESKAGGPEAAAAGRPAGLASARSYALVEAVRRFATAPGPEADVPWAPHVLVRAEGPVAVDMSVPAAAASQRATWTAPDLFAGLAATRPARLRIDDEHHVTCRGSPREQAAGFEDQEWVSVQPRVDATSCRGWWAVDLYLDDRDRIEAVMLRP